MERVARLALIGSLAWLAITGWSIVHGTERLERDAVALLVCLAVIAVAGWMLMRVAHERRGWQQALDAMQAGIVLYDDEDRLRVANTDFRRLYEVPGAPIVEGMSFEALLQSRVRAGLVPDAAGREQDWIAERVAEHRDPATRSFVRRMADGRWRRITEQTLADGGRLGFSVDVTEMIEQQVALQQARAEAQHAHRLLDEAIEAMPAAVEIHDAQDRLLVASRHGAAIDVSTAGADTAGLRLDGLPQAGPRLQQEPDGSWTHVYETPMASGGRVTVRLDATETVQQREALETALAQADASRATLADAIEALPDGFALYDAEDRLVLCNQRYRDIYVESAPAMALGARFEDIVRYGLERGQYPQASADPEGWLAERVRRHRHPDGVPILQELQHNRWLRIDERLTRSGGIAGVRTDVTELVRTRQQLERLSSTDGLTGVANRRRFDAALAEEVQRSQRHGTTLALLLVDIDHFKRYNDHHGHPEGDRALQAVAALLARQARRPAELVARYGGEEFALLLPHADAAIATGLAQRCLAALDTLAWPHGASPTADRLTLSIGIATLRLAGREDAASLLRRADAALYAAKSEGRARCVVAPPAESP
jgi:diguanylate cyclase (GGDEF)-like protein